MVGRGGPRTVEVSGVTQCRLQDRLIGTSDYRRDAFQRRTGRQPAHSVRAPQVQVLPRNPDASRQLGIADSIRMLVRVNEIHKMSGCHASSVG